MARVKDLWWTSSSPRRKTARHPDNGGKKDAKRYLACWIGPDGRERTRAFPDNARGKAKRYAEDMEADARRGTYVEPRAARTTVREWCATWLAGYRTRRPKTVRSAQVHIAKILDEFGDLPLSAVRPSHVRAWCARLKDEGAAPSYVHALHGRLSQIMGDAVHDGLLVRSPCSRRTSPGAGKQRPYVATTAQVWALYDAMGERYRAAVLLAAFAGLRVAEACGLRVADVDFLRGVISPAVQYPADELKTEVSRTPIPIPRLLAEHLSAQVAAYPAETILTSTRGGQLAPRTLDDAFAAARDKVAGLPDGFRYHDLRHYFASLLIASGADVKTVQARLRHASAKTTLDTYAHLWPDRDESTRAAVEAVLAARAEQSRNQGEAR
ncbi:tyrosine recombinase XerC [Actinomadura sp. SCN-SB]|uniref:site-specific integrase n=1 Tax=Actinomadura sp. SCN-SB TaxID=3373092 RepID=UPI0037511546